MNKKWIIRCTILAVLLIVGSTINQGFAHYSRPRHDHSKNIGIFDSITMNDDGCIGISLTGPRICFDSSPANIELLDGNVWISDTTGDALKLLDVQGSTRIVGTGTVTLTGTIDPAASTTVDGVGTLFLTELVIGDQLVVSTENRTVTAIASDIQCTVDAAFSNNGNDTTPDKIESHFVIVDSGGTTDFIIDADGKIGSGIIAPTANLHIFQDSPIADQELFQIGTSSDADIFNVDEDGDVAADGSLRILEGAVTMTSVSSQFKVTVAGSAFTGGTLWAGSGTVGRKATFMHTFGVGAGSELAIGENVNQADFLIKRDIDGASSFSEAGTLLRLEKDVTNVTAETGNYLEWVDTVGGTLGSIDENGDLNVVGDIIQTTDVGYPDKYVIKTFGIFGSGLDQNFANDADSVEQVLTFTTLIPAGATITEARLECDESTAGSGSTVITIEVGTTSSGAELLTGADTTTDNEINSTAAGAGIVVAANASATTVYVAADPAANWDTLTAGEWDIIIYYRDGGAARAQKGL